MFMMLGAAGYAKLTSPTSFDLDKRVDYAEHQITEGKPLLQYMGPGLDEVELSFMFHEEFTDPQAAWDQLAELQAAHVAFPVLMGNGKYLGDFVLTTLNRTTTVSSKYGRLREIGCRVTLREWVDPQPLETRKTAKKSRAKAVKKSGRKKLKTKKTTVPKATKSGTDKKTIVRQ